MGGNYIALGTIDGQFAIFEIIDTTYRKTLSGPFQAFSIDRHRIIFNTTNIPDTVFLYKVTKWELRLNFRDGIDYVQ